MHYHISKLRLSKAAWISASVSQQMREKSLMHLSSSPSMIVRQQLWYIRAIRTISADNSPALWWSDANHWSVSSGKSLSRRLRSLFPLSASRCFCQANEQHHLPVRGLIYGGRIGTCFGNLKIVKALVAMIARFCHRGNLWFIIDEQNLERFGHDVKVERSNRCLIIKQTSYIKFQYFYDL